MTVSDSILGKAKINLETSLIAWSSLQRFFAAGQTICVTEGLDLVEVAYHFSMDHKMLTQQWLQENKVAPVTDQQARIWLENNCEVWAVVVKPWVLVQNANGR